ncbi:hypothetical protein F0562_017446 [Nyssa sinensis]|uniref:Uncharacterized protein n=1 Tax=Nyssa sinensis TaxID=561372 RepID=A0A5J4ZEV2_9ASTE|nr:hypothetical protein F0562_017446 [Nyssa sinensis]
MWTLYNLYSKPTRHFLHLFSTVASLPHAGTHTSPPIPNPSIVNYLIEAFGFPERRARSISNRFLWIETTEKPQSVVHFFKQLGLSETHIRSSVRISPQILFSDIDKTLKPKLQFFQELGLTGSDLGRFISMNSTLFTRNLDGKLVRCIEIIKKTLTDDDNNQDLIRVLKRCNWVSTKDPDSRMLGNISYLESCGIVGSQLSVLLKRQPLLFIMQESALRDLVSRVIDMGFSTDSRMLVHAVFTVSCMSIETFARKLELFRSFGFSKDECMGMFRRAPGLLRTSEEKLKLGFEFFMNHTEFGKPVLLLRPTSLMYSLEERVIPRYRVFQILKSKKLLKKGLNFVNLLSFSEEKFLEKFISRFRDDAEELLLAYKAIICIPRKIVIATDNANDGEALRKNKNWKQESVREQQSKDASKKDSDRDGRLSQMQ